MLVRVPLGRSLACAALLGFVLALACPALADEPTSGPTAGPLVAPPGAPPVAVGPATGPATAAKPAEKPGSVSSATLILTEENDFFAGTDEHYTCPL